MMPPTAFCAAVAAVAEDGSALGPAVDTLIEQLTTTELLGLLDGDETILQGLTGMVRHRRYMAEPVVAGRVERLGIPGIRFTDGPRGVSIGRSTSFPVAIARAASWDPELETEIGDAIGREARAQKANFVGGICVNLAPAPGWGRSQESYGEDPVLIGAMGAALHCGSAPWVMTCVKHFALNSMDDARLRLDVTVDEATLHEVYLPHFRTVVEAGVDAVMTSYNKVNGDWAGDSAALLTDVLRGQWDFKGFVMTDFVWGLRDPVGSVRAGQDLEMPYRQQRAATLLTALTDGELCRGDAEAAARRLLGTQIRWAVRTDPTSPPRDVIACIGHQQLARRAASRGAVLLRNEVIDGSPVLPLSEADRLSVAVIGPLAAADNLGDVGSSQVHPPDGSVRTIVDALRTRLGVGAVLSSTTRDVLAATTIARTAKAAIVVVGLTPHDEGESLKSVDAECVRLLGGVAAFKPVAEALSWVVRTVTRLTKMGGDRRDLRLHRDDVALVEAVAAVNARTTVVVIGGGTVVLDPWDAEVAAILLAWYPGMMGGEAVADVLLGDVEPGGRLPLTIPRCRTDLPTVDWDARTAAYGSFWGQRHLDRRGTLAAYPFGYGLGYTTFAISDVTATRVGAEGIEIDVSVTNTGGRRGRHVVQVYGSAVDGATSPAARALLGFGSVDLDAGASTRITVVGTVRPLQRWVRGAFTLDLPSVRIEASSYSGDPLAAECTLVFGSEPAPQGD